MALAQRSTAAWAAIVLGLGLIFAATLPPDAPSPLTHGFNSCVFCGELGGQDFVLNVPLFVPLGVGLALLGWPLGRAALAGLALSAVVELLQLVVIPGRVSALGDLVANALGCALGATVTRHWRTLAFPGREAARALAFAGAAAALAALALGAWGLQLSLPRTVYWTQWQPDLGQFDRYSGQVLGGTLSGTPLPPPFSSGSALLRQRLVGGPIALAAVATPGEPTARLAPILSVFDEHQVEVLVLGQLGRKLVFRVRSRAADLKLRPPAIALDEFFAPAPEPGDTLRVLAEHTGRALRLGGARARGDGAGAREQPFSPLLVWSFFYPFDRPVGRLADLLSALTAAVLLLPVAYWERRWVRRAGVALVGPLAVLLLGLGPLPVAFGLPVAPWWQWGAGLAGALAGWGLAARAKV